MKKIFYDPAHPSAFSGVKKLHKAVNGVSKRPVTIKTVKDWLKTQDTYTVHRSVQRKFPRARIIVSGIDEQWEIDLFDLSSLAKYNNGMKFGLMVIDVFSRYVFVRMLQRKTPKEVSAAFSDILDKSGRKPSVIRSDAGKEFEGVFRDFLKDSDIHRFISHSEYKASMAERSNKSIKAKLFKYMSANQTFKYIDVLQDIVKGYNSSVHSALGRTPESVTKDNESEVAYEQYIIRKGRKKFLQKRKIHKLAVGDKVRLAVTRRTFAREYDEKFTQEIFVIRDILYKEHIPMYLLEDYAGEEVHGAFYPFEIIPVIEEPNKAYKVEKILNRRTVRGRPEILVRYYGWSPKFDEWIPETNLENIRKP
jgi:hypothetical protein